MRKLTLHNAFRLPVRMASRLVEMEHLRDLELVDHLLEHEISVKLHNVRGAPVVPPTPMSHHLIVPRDLASLVLRCGRR